MTLQIALGNAAEHFRRSMMRQFSTGKRLGGTVMWLGAPGMAKSALQVATAKEVAQALSGSILVHTVTLADIEVVDVKGMGLPGKNPETAQFDRIVYTRSGILPTPEQEKDFDFIFLQVDEVPAATLDHCKVTAQLFLDYRLGSVVLPASKYFVAATGNDVSHKAGAIRVPSHVINRMCVHHCEADVRPWLAWSSTDEAQVPPLARAFVEMQPSLFTDEGELSKVGPNKPFTTLRSFTLGVQDLVSTFSPAAYHEVPKASDPASFDNVFSEQNAPIAAAILCGYIGEGVATQFMSWSKVRHLLTPLADILRDPDGAPVPSDISAAFAQASYVISWADEKSIEAMFTYTQRFRRDMVVPTIVSLKKKVKKITMCRGFAEWANKNHDLLITTFAASAN